MNILRAVLGGVREINPVAYQEQFSNQSHFVLDVRSTNEFSSQHIEGAVNIPLNKLPKKLEKLPKDQTIVCISRDGVRGREAAHLLQNKGFKTANIVGGMVEWRRANADQS